MKVLLILFLCLIFNTQQTIPAQQITPNDSWHFYCSIKNGCEVTDSQGNPLMDKKYWLSLNDTTGLYQECHIDVNPGIGDNCREIPEQSAWCQNVNTGKYELWHAHEGHSWYRDCVNPFVSNPTTKLDTAGTTLPYAGTVDFKENGLIPTIEPPQTIQLEGKNGKKFIINAQHLWDDAGAEQTTLSFTQEGSGRIDRLSDAEYNELQLRRKAVADEELAIARAHNVILTDPNESCFKMQSSGYAIACAPHISLDGWEIRGQFLLVNVPSNLEDNNLDKNSIILYGH